jgi:hypothetical protein
LESEAYPIRRPSSRRGPNPPSATWPLGSPLSLRLPFYGREEAAQDGKPRVNLVLRAIGDRVRRPAALTALWAGRVAVQNQLADQVEPFNRESTKINGVPWSEAFRLARCKALLNDLFVKGRLQVGACRSKAARAEAFLNSSCTANNAHATIRSIGAQFCFGANTLTARIARNAEVRDWRTRP